MNTDTDSKSMSYDQMVKALEELCERIESMRQSSMKPEAEFPKQQDAGNSSVNLDQMLMALQERIHALTKRVIGLGLTQANGLKIRTQRSKRLQDEF